MRKWFSSPHQHLLTFLAHDSEMRPKKQALRIRAAVENQLSLLMQDTRSHLPQLAPYPWCFALPVPALTAESWFCGAMLARDGDTPAVVGALLRSSELLRQLEPRENLVFWMMRALALLAQSIHPEETSKQIQADCHELVASRLPAFWRPNVKDSPQRLQLLSRLSEMRCEADFELEGNTAIEVMPWRNWPACVVQQDMLWLWRQNRQGNVVETQRKLMVNPATAVPAHLLLPIGYQE